MFLSLVHHKRQMLVWCRWACRVLRRAKPLVQDNRKEGILGGNPHIFVAADIMLSSASQIDGPLSSAIVLCPWHRSMFPSYSSLLSTYLVASLHSIQDNPNPCSKSRSSHLRIFWWASKKSALPLNTYIEKALEAGKNTSYQIKSKCRKTRTYCFGRCSIYPKEGK